MGKYEKSWFLVKSGFLGFLVIFDVFDKNGQNARFFDTPLKNDEKHPIFACFFIIFHQFWGDF